MKIDATIEGEELVHVVEEYLSQKMGSTFKVSGGITPSSITFSGEDSRADTSQRPTITQEEVKKLSPFKICRRLGMSPAEVALQIGVSLQTLHRWERKGVPIEAHNGNLKKLWAFATGKIRG